MDPNADTYRMNERVRGEEGLGRIGRGREEEKGNGNRTEEEKRRRVEKGKGE